MWFLTHTWIIPALMALSFLLILLFGKRLPQKGSEIGVAAVGICFVLALLTAGSWWSRTSNDEPAGREPSDCRGRRRRPLARRRPTALADVAGGLFDGSRTSLGGPAPSTAPRPRDSPRCDAPPAPTRPCPNDRMPTRPRVEEADESDQAGRPLPRRGSRSARRAAPSITIGTMVDGQSVFMLVVVTLISLLVHIYSTDYVGGDRRYTHYFAFLSLFTASMLFFVLSQSTIQMIVGWELVGVCSFVLIGHWWEEKPNSNAALKAFLTNRVGDIGLLVGMIVLYFAADRSFSILDINILAADGQISHGILLLASCCLIAAVMSKSGQFILHTWLPDAMAGPTPVSALIHAATMVVAGHLPGRTALPGVLRGARRSPVRRSTCWRSSEPSPRCSGRSWPSCRRTSRRSWPTPRSPSSGSWSRRSASGAWTAAMFHLFTHAMFKACLFLGAGSMSHACHHSFDMVDDYGGLRKDHAADVLDLPHRHRGAGRDLPAVGFLVQGRDPRRARHRPSATAATAPTT